MSLKTVTDIMKTISLDESRNIHKLERGIIQSMANLKI